MAGRHQPAGGGGRKVRVAEQVHHELAELIRGEVKDPRIGMVTVTGVDITPDYAYATVHFTVLPDDPTTVAHTQAGLERASGFLRGQLGRRVRIHTTPELRFLHDESTAHGMEMSKLIDEAVRRKADD
jgi:ribosome-binding factor A